MTNYFPKGILSKCQMSFLSRLKRTICQIFCFRGRPVEQFYWTSSRFQRTSNRNSTGCPVEIFIAFFNEISNSKTFEANLQFQWTSFRILILDVQQNLLDVQKKYYRTSSRSDDLGHCIASTKLVSPLSTQVLNVSSQAQSNSNCLRIKLLIFVNGETHFLYFDDIKL